MPMSTATNMKASKTSVLFQAERALSSKAMATMGASSPQVPKDSTLSPTGVPMSLRSLRMGMSVPMAVVVSAMATAMASMVSMSA